MKPFTPRLSIFCIKLFGLLLAMGYGTTRLSGQIQAGQVYLGGSFGWKKNLDVSPNPNLSLDPTVGVMLSSRWSAGFGLPFAYNIGYENGINNVYFTPFIRYYKEIKPKFHFITEFKTTMRVVGYRENEIPDHYLLLRLTPMLNYMLGSKFALEADFGSLYYARSKNYTAFDSFFSHFYRAEFRLWPNFTFRYYIPKK